MSHKKLIGVTIGFFGLMLLILRINKIANKKYHYTGVDRYGV